MAAGALALVPGMLLEFELNVSKRASEHRMLVACKVTAVGGGPVAMTL